MEMLALPGTTFCSDASLPKYVRRKGCEKAHVDGESPAVNGVDESLAIFQEPQTQSREKH